MLLDAEYGSGWRVRRTLENPGAPENLRIWRADLIGFGPSGVCVLVDVDVTCLAGDSAMRSRGEEMRSRVEALLRDAELRKMRNPRTGAATRAHNALFVPFVLSSNGALGARANTFLKQAFGFVKKEGWLGMRSSHPRRAATWSTTRFSTFWRQRISTAATATSAAFVDRAIRADQAAAFEGPRGPASPIPASHGNTTTTTRTTSVNTRNTGADPKGAGATAVAPMSCVLAATAGVAPSGVGATAAAA